MTARARRSARLFAALALTATAVCADGPANAADNLGADSVAEIADALRADRLYVDPGIGEAFTDGQISQLQVRLGQSETPVFLAILATDEVIQASEEQSRQALANEPAGEPTGEPTDDPGDGEIDGEIDEPSDEPGDEPTDEPFDEVDTEPTDEPTSGATGNATPDPSAGASASATGDSGGLPGQIARAMNVPGTFAVVEGTSFHATSTVIPDVERFAAEAAASGADTTTALLEFVDAVEVAASQVGGSARLDEEKKDAGSSTWVIALVAVGAALLYALRRKPKPPA